MSEPIADKNAAEISPPWPEVLAAPSLWALAALAAASVGMRLGLALVNVNEAEYTDGILQLTLFSRGNPYWPPLYSALAVLTGKAVGDLELGGRLVSAVLGGLAVVPISAMAGKIGGRRAGVMAGVAFMAAPEALRWGVRVMTDASFLTLFAASLCLLMPRQEGAPSSGRIIWGTVVAVLATLTRYQGLILVFPILWGLVRAWREKRCLAAPLAAQILWLAIPLWIVRGGFAHLQQVLQRTGADEGLSPVETLLSYWNLAECYFLFFPYSLTPPIFLCFLAGLFLPRVCQRRTGRWFLAVFLLAGALILATQAVFGIFEFRYLLPLLAFVLPFAGMGLDRLDRALANRRNLAMAVFCVVLGWPVLFSAASLLFQRQAFGDIKAASQFAAQAVGPDVRVVSNECYNDKIPVVKTSFWVGREVQRAQLDTVQEGDCLILSSLYSGGVDLMDYWERMLQSGFHIQELARFDGMVLPLLPDIMSIRGAHGSPLAWFYRYQWQNFFTVVVRIGEAKP